MSNVWVSDPCDEAAGWTGETTCTLPYGRGPYGMGPYGHCDIMSNAIWVEESPTAPFSGSPPQPSPFRRAA